MASRYTYSRDYFYSIDSEDKAYWLGFIYADGCIENNSERRIHRLVITLSQKDTGHLEKLSSALNFSGEVKYRTRSYKTDRPDTKECILSIPGKQIVKDLIESGCGPKKTFNLAPTKLQPRFVRHFLRGYFDGDGCIHQDQKGRFSISFCCTYEMGLYIKEEIIKNLNIDMNKICPMKSIYTIRKAAQQDVKTILTWLYKDATIYLDRKYDLYIKALNEIASAT